MAEESLRAATVLRDSDCLLSAVSRAYYAMFDGARAALLASGFELESARTHNGILVAFTLRLIKSGQLSKEMGQRLQRAEWIRNLSDYRGDVCDQAEADELIEHAQGFVADVKAYILRMSDPHGQQGMRS